MRRAMLALLIPAVLLVGCGRELSEGDKMELLGGATPQAEHDHSQHAPGRHDLGDPHPAAATGTKPQPGAANLPTDYQGCAWYSDVAGTTVCVPDPLPKEVTGKKACEYLRTQGYGPLTLLTGANKGRGSDDPVKIDDNGDGTACGGGDWGQVEAPPDASGGGIVE